jgi:hypothetical protein
VSESVVAHHRRIFNTGDQVTVRSAREILATLGPDGTLDGLPFMPECWIGVARHFASCDVSRRPALRAIRCGGSPKTTWSSWTAPACDGHAHDGCKHACRLFWKEAWLRPIDTTATTQRSDARPEAGLEQLRVRLKVKSDERRYFCQSTELFRATRAFPRPRRAGRCGSRSRGSRREPLRGEDAETVDALPAAEIAACRRPRGWLHGPHKRTPTESLTLKAGDVVRIRKSRRDCPDAGLQRAQPRHEHLF